MKEKVMLGIICLETLIIFFFVFSIYIHINRFKSEYKPIKVSKFSNENVYKELNLNDFQKKNYDKILLDFTERQKEINIRQEQNFKKLHKATSDPNATNEEIDKLKNEQIDIISNKISTPVDYIQNIRKILNKDQLLIFCSIIEKKEIYKIMPPPIKKRPKRKKLEDFRKNN